MKKLLPLLTLCLLCVCCMVGFTACNNNNANNTKSYYGTYKALNTDEKIIINNNDFVLHNTAYSYDVTYDYFTLKNYSEEKSKWYRYENDNVLSDITIWHFNLGYLSTRNGLFNAYLEVFDSTSTINAFTIVLAFRDNGEYNLIFPRTPGLSENGTYTLENGLLTLTGVRQNPIQKITTKYYIDENYKIHLNVYVKDITKFYNTEHTDTPTDPAIPETHTHDFTDTVIEPTCTTGGYTLHECSCGEKYTDTFTSALNHNYISAVVAPTCTEQGFTTYTCTRCLDTYKDNETPALGHIFVENGLPVGCCALTTKQDCICTRCGVKQTPDTHNHLNTGETCVYCNWTVYNKTGDNVLMKNSEDKLSAEFYGTGTYTWNDSIKAYITNAYISDSVTSIGYYAFSYCSSLTSITIPDSVTSIERDAFNGCTQLEESENGLLYAQNILIGVSNTSGLPNSHYSIRNGTKIIANRAFESDIIIIQVDIPDSVTSIGVEAFRGCSSLTSITIPDSVTSIGNGAFWDCSSLTSITIPDSVTSIGYYAFSYCSSLTSIVIPYSVTSIGYSAFSDCSSLTSITIPDSVTSIGYSAFSDCSSLTSITIPDSVTSIGNYAFYDCSSLTSITFCGTQEQLESINKGGWKYYAPSSCIIHCTDGDINITQA